MKVVELKDIIRVSYGKALKAEDRISSGKFAVYGSSGEIGRHDASIVNHETIIIGRKGSVGSITYARTGGWPIDTAYYTESINQHQIDLKYLFYALKHAKLDQFTMTTSIPGLNREDIYRSRILLPPLTDQQRIAAILDKADALRQKRREALAQLDRLLQAVFVDMFGDPVTNPKGWPVIALSEYGNIVTGNTPSRGKPIYYGCGLEWIKSDNINTPQHFLTQATECLSDEGRKVARFVPKGSILVTCIAGSPSCIGNAAIADREVAFNQQINAIVPDELDDTYFLYGHLLAGKRLIQSSSTDSMKGMVSKSTFSAIKFLAPPPNERHKFGEFFATCNLQRSMAERAMDVTDALFASLQTRAFAGEL